MVNGINRTNILCGMALAMALATFISSPVKADPDVNREWLSGAPESPTEAWEIALGGRLYDNWAEVTGAPEPEQSHAAYPASAKKKGYATWRCKECHGWDYMGKDGAYSKGSHYTGIKGLRGLVGKSLEMVRKAIRDEVHGYKTSQISEKAGRWLALFVTRGQHDVERFIRRESRTANGDAGLGERMFQNICAVCHGFDGKAINFKSDEDPEFIGTVASENPWETLHKIRNGQPAAIMPSLRALPVQTLVDILSYAQTLQEK